MTSQDFPRRRRRRRRSSVSGSGQVSMNASSTKHRPQDKMKSIRTVTKQNQTIIQKLDIRYGYLICLVNPPENFFRWLSKQLPQGCRLQLGLPRQPTLGIALYWPESAQNLDTAFKWMRSKITDYGAMWVVIIKKNYRDKRILGISLEELQQAAKNANMVDNKTVNLVESEYGVRLVPRRERPEKELPAR